MRDRLYFALGLLFRRGVVMLRQAYATRGQGKSARGRDLHHAETDVAEKLKVMTTLGKRTDKSGST